MPRSSPLRKFGPLAAIAGVQLLIVLLVPSVASKPAADTLGQTGSGAALYGSGATGTGAAPGAAGTTGGAVAPGGAAGAGGSATAAGANGQPAPRGASATVKKQLGDTSHCVSGRQFNPATDYFAPPCVPGVPGGAYPSDNGGATWQGVTKDRIEFVNYIPDYGAEVNTILKAQGLYYNSDQAKVFNAAFEKFINAHYNLYGRKVHIDTYQGTCATVPPDYQCLNGEMDKMVATYHPYGAVFSTTLCSACYAELARLKVVSTGGTSFSDAFHSANAPYIYDQTMSSTRMMEQFADTWCHQMTSKGGSGRTAIFAGGQNASQDFRKKPRVLGVVASNDPDIQATVKNVLYPALKKGCGETVTHQYFYASDISTATQQSNAGVAAMNTPNNPATSVLCLCDPVAPQFTYSASAMNNYWPEPLVASTQSMDTDSISQTYEDNGGAATLACPSPQRGCPFDSAVGIGAELADVAPGDLSGMKAFKAGGGGTPPIGAPILQIFWDNYQMLTSMIENTGPLLTPARMQGAAPSMGMRGGGTTGHALRGFTPGQSSWTRDVRVLYWDKKKKSLFNGKAGAWVQIEGGRKDSGKFPTLEQPPAPPADKRD